MEENNKKYKEFIDGYDQIKNKVCNDFDQTLRIKLILERAYELAFDLAIRLGTSDVEKAQDEAWMKVAGVVNQILKDKDEECEKRINQDIVKYEEQLGMEGL